MIYPSGKANSFLYKKQMEENWVSGQTCITTATEIQVKPRVLPIGRPKLVRQKSFEIDSSDEGGEKMKQGRLPPAITTTSSSALTDCIENQVWAQIDLTAFISSPCRFAKLTTFWHERIFRKSAASFTCDALTYSSLDDIVPLKEYFFYKCLT